MSANNRENDIQSSVKTLIEHHLKSANQSQINNLQQYLLRIITSRIQQPRQSDAEIKNMVQAKVLQVSEDMKQSKHSAHEKLLRCQELIIKLSKTRVLKQKWNSIYLLYKLANQNFGSQGYSKIPFFNESIIQQDNTMEQEEEINTNKMDLEYPPVEQKNSDVIDQKELIQKISNKGNYSTNLSEQELIRDIIFALQAIDSTNIGYDKQENAIQVRSHVIISKSSRKLINKICELGWLFKKLNEFLQQSPQGLIQQALHYAIKDELNEYYRLLAVLENYKSQQNDSLTIRKLCLWTMEPTERLNWLSVLVDNQNNAKGSVIISTIFSFQSHGSPQIQKLIQRIFSQVLQPFVKFVNQWIFNGILVDTMKEFFISDDETIIDDQLIWTEKYQLHHNKIPIFLDQIYAEKILIAGKCVKFIRKCCDIQDFKIQEQPFDLEELNTNYQKGIRKFQKWIDDLTMNLNNTLVQLLKQKFQLNNHFKVIKRYLLLGQGDFIENLMEKLSPELDKQATMIYRHNLLSMIEHVVKPTNYFQQFFDNLDVKLFEPSPNEKGWDIFSLDYRTIAPINTILNKSIMQNYLKLFNFLWRVKRVEHLLSDIWTQYATFRRQYENQKQYQKYKPQLRKCHLLRNEMFHFVKNFQNYLMLEVIEASWTDFESTINNAQSIDEILELHKEMIQQMLIKSLLTNKNIGLYKLLIKVFDLFHRFKFTQDILINTIQDQLKQEQYNKNQKEITNILNHNNDNQMEIDELGEDNFINPEAFKHLKGIHKEFKATFYEFSEQLKKEDQNGPLRFLKYKLDFNEYYQNIHQSLSTSYGGNLIDKSIKMGQQHYGLKVKEDFVTKDRLKNMMQIEQPIKNSEIKSPYVPYQSKNQVPSVDFIANVESIQVDKKEFGSNIPFQQNFMNYQKQVNYNSSDPKIIQSSTQAGSLAQGQSGQNYNEQLDKKVLESMFTHDDDEEIEFIDDEDDDHLSDSD